MTEIPIQRVHMPLAQQGSIKVFHDEVTGIMLQTHGIHPTTAERNCGKQEGGCGDNW